MKRKTFLFLVSLMTILIVNGNAFGQLGLRKGIKIGYNLATVTGDHLNGVESRKSFAGGIGIEFNFIGLLSFQVDALYSPKGYISSDNTVTSLNYISVPMVLKKKFFPVGLHPYILGGAEFNFLLSAKTAGTDIKDQLTSEDLAFVIGGGLEFSFLRKSAYLEGRYSYGLNNINKNAEQGESKNRVTQIFFGFLF